MAPTLLSFLMLFLFSRMHVVYDVVHCPGILTTVGVHMCYIISVKYFPSHSLNLHAASAEHKLVQLWICF